MYKGKCLVLNPSRKGVVGEASRKAMLAYADVIREENFKLSEDLYELVGNMEFKKMKVCDGRI